MRPALLTLVLTLAAVVAACSENSNDSASGGGSGTPPDAGQPTPDIQFPGISLADALGPTEVFLSWPDAVLLPNLVGAQAMRYRIFRGATQQEAADATDAVYETGPGVTAWVDTGLDPFTTYYYRVVAVDTNERTSLSARVTNARTVSVFGGGDFDYDTQLLPLFSSPSPTNPATSCLTCHTTPGPGSLDLSSREGAYIGVGTSQAPDSFVIAFDGDATWMTAHLPWFSDPVGSGLAAMEAPLREWSEGGGSLAPDITPPVFALGGVNQAGNYFGEFIDFDTIRITFPHADDPETLPPNGNRAGQIEYAIYGGVRTNDIDWDTPLALAFVSQAAQADPVVTAEFDWALGGIATIVVRPIDSAGRGVTLDYPPQCLDFFTYPNSGGLPKNPATGQPYPQPATPLEWYTECDEMRALMAERMRNQNPNEAEIVVIR
jgi:hypothetical protein